MTIIRKLSIEGFKSILKQEINLGRLNVFIGTNGSGKSNLLEAVAMISSSIEGGIDYERLSRRGARLSSPQIFRSSFRNKRRRNTFTIKATTDSVKYTISINAVNGFFYNAESLKDSSTQETLCGRSNVGETINRETLKNRLDREKSIIPIYRSFASSDKGIKTLENFAIFSPSTPILRGIASDNSNKAPLGLYGGRLAEAIDEVLNDPEKKEDILSFFKLLDWFKQVGTTNQTDKDLISEHVSLGRRIVIYKDQFMATNFNDLYAYDVSEGALFILFVLVLLCHGQSPNFFAIDNIDSALNPGLIRNLMSHISDYLTTHKEKQLLLTTHNPSTLDSIDLFNNDHRLFVVKRSNDGQTIIERISPPEGMTKLQWEEKYFGLRMSEIWMSGAIGGLVQPIGF